LSSGNGIMIYCCYCPCLAAKLVWDSDSVV
jgi:hypothetical protein